jgi:hypothetical protein
MTNSMDRFSINYDVRAERKWAGRRPHSANWKMKQGYPQFRFTHLPESTESQTQVLMEICSVRRTGRFEIRFALSVFLRDQSVLFVAFEHNPIWEADSPWLCQRITRLLCESKSNCSVQKPTVCLYFEWNNGMQFLFFSGVLHAPPFLGDTIANWLQGPEFFLRS